MSVYTRVERPELAALLGEYSVGELVDFEGIEAGIENTNYFVDTEGGRWVLTLFERLRIQELPYFLNLMDHLARHGIPSAHPVADRMGSFLKEINGKPAALVYRLEGASLEHPQAVHCRAVGRVLADLHLAGASYPGRRENARGPSWWRRTRDIMADHLDSEDLTLLDDELAFQYAQRDLDLPRGVIHADLFRDNTLFVGDRLSGLIDFYFACNDVLLFDLAVLANDWCLDDTGELNEDHLAAVLRSYHQERPLTAVEQAAWPVLLRSAALRFWLSRLYDAQFPRDGEVTHVKDPTPYRKILLRHREQPLPLTLE